MNITAYSKPKIVLKEIDTLLVDQLKFKKEILGNNNYRYLSLGVLIEIKVELGLVWFVLKTKHSSNIIEYISGKRKEIDYSNILIVRYNSIISNVSFLKLILELNNVISISSSTNNRIITFKKEETYGIHSTETY